MQDEDAEQTSHHDTHKQEIDENEVSETQIFINEDIQKQETSIVSDCSTIQDLMDLDGGYER